MRPGLEPGLTRSTTVTVTDAMTATVGERQIHPTYGTVAFVRHVEELGRRLLEPHLEPGEEGVGYRIEARHVRPVAVGTRLRLTATVLEVRDDRLVCEAAAAADDEVAARAVFEQRIVPAEDFAARLRAGGAQ